MRALIFFIPLLAYSLESEKIFKKINNKTMDESIKYVFQTYPELKDNFSLAYDSRSPIETNMESPRVIVVNFKGDFTAAWGGNSKLRKNDRIEFIEYDRKNQRNIFNVIDFSSGKAKYLKDQRAKCVGCHGFRGNSNEMRHIWDMYPQWPGIYGSGHNMSPIVKGRGRSLKIHNFEKEALKKFLQKRKSNPRYAPLDFKTNPVYKAEYGYQLDQYEKESNDKEKEFHIIYDTLVEKNLLLGSIFGQQNLVRLKNRLINSPHFFKYFWIRKTSSLIDSFSLPYAKDLDSQKYTFQRKEFKRKKIQMSTQKFSHGDDSLKVADIHTKGSSLASFMKKNHIPYEDLSMNFVTSPFGIRSFNHESFLYKDKNGKIQTRWSTDDEDLQYIGFKVVPREIFSSDSESVDFNISIYDKNLDFKKEALRLLALCKNEEDVKSLKTILPEYKEHYSEDQINFLKDLDSPF